MKVAPFSIEDVDYVLRNLWRRGQDEITVMGLTIPDVRTLLSKVDQNISFAIHGEEEEPLVVMGAFSLGDGEYSTWFMAVELERRQLIEMVRLCRAVILDKAKDLKVNRINCYSPCIHPRAPEWFKAIGFHEVLHNSPPLRRFVIDFA